MPSIIQKCECYTCTIMTISNWKQDWNLSCTKRENKCFCLSASEICLKILKMSHSNVSILAIFFTYFCTIKLTCLVTLFDRMIHAFKNSPKLIIFGIFNELLSSTKNVKVARFARNVEWDFFWDLQTSCWNWNKPTRETQKE